MAGRSLALAALAALALVPLGAAAASDDLSIDPVLRVLGPEPSPVPLPAPGGPFDAPPGSGRAPSPVAPDLVGPTGGEGAMLAVAGAGALLGVAGVAVWGVTRFRDTEEVLRHEIRSKIYRYVQDHVGASLKDITEALGLSTTNAVWHLRKLEDTGLLRGRKVNGAKVYYPTSGGVHARDLSVAGAALTSGNARAILDVIARHPGVHQREVARLLAINHGTVRWHLQKLRNAALLEERRAGAATSYHVTALGTEALRAVGARSPGGVSAGVAADTAFPPPATQA